MAKAKAKKTTRRKNSNKSKANKMPNNLVGICVVFLLCALSIIALFQFGLVGSVLFRLFLLLFGNFAVVIFIFIILSAVLFLCRFDFTKVPLQYYLSIALLSLAWIVLQGLREIVDGQGWSVIKNILYNVIHILEGEYTTACGILGASLTGIFYSLFAEQGTYIFIFFSILLSLCLIGYAPLSTWYHQREPKPKKQKEKTKKLPEKEPIFVDLDAENLVFQEEEDEIQQPTIHTVDSDEPPKEQEEPTFEPAQYIPDEDEAYASYRLPRLTILQEIARRSKNSANYKAAQTQGEKLIEILNEFGVKATLVQIHIGPSVTKFEIRPDLGVRVNRISNLQYDIKMALAAKDIRIEAPIPGKSAVGIEVPNVEKTTVQMKELMKNIPPSLQDKALLFCLGKDLMGKCVYGELNRMPHLLIAGSTGSGKSVCVNSIICSFLLRTRPDEVKLILIDPKKVEFTPYNDVPHLLAPVITDGDLANKALKVVVQIMEHRYDLFGKVGVRNLQSYNDLVKTNQEDGLKPLPRIVIVIDELADLMLVAAKEVETSIQRITQLARAAGIHLIVATQRPSVDVITGVIKANIPSRIAFAVSSSTDSRTILDQAGADRLLGYGDMLYLPNGESTPKRIQGVFIQDEEVNRIASYVKSQAVPHYDDSFIQLRDLQNQGGTVENECSDPLYESVKEFVIHSRKASTSLIQRKFSIGYSRAARLIDTLEDQGIIGPANGSKPRKILVSRPYEEEMEG